MWKLFRGLKEATTETDETLDDPLDEIDLEINSMEDDHLDLSNKKKKKNTDNTNEAKSPIEKGQSKPRLYI
jgi:hypothetical protein